MFGELIDAKLPLSSTVRVPKAGSQRFTGVYLGKDTEADEVVLGNACLQGQDCEKKIAFSTMECIVCHENGLHTLAGGVEMEFESTAFVMPPDLGVKGRVRPPPGLEERVEEEVEVNVELEDMAPGPSESVTEARH